MNGQGLTLRLSPRTLGLLGLLALGALALFLALKPAAAELTGTIKGHAFTVGGTALGNEVPAQDRVDLPPGGSHSSGPIDQGVAGVFSFHADSRDISCTGQASGSSVTASCTTDIHNVIVTAGGQKVFSADRIIAVSNSADSGGGAHSDATGTQYTNLCVFSTALSPCQQVGPDDDVPLNTVLLTGGIEIDHRDCGLQTAARRAAGCR